MGKAWAMCFIYNVLVNRWDEFVLTMCYLSNHTPVVLEDSHTLFYLNTGTAISLIYLTYVKLAAESLYGV